LRVIVPQGVPVSVNAHAKVGDVEVLGNKDSGRNASLNTGTGGGLTIDARVGLGRVEVDRAG
jgi:predicted membrane protein